MTRFYICNNGNKLFMRRKINQAIKKAHAELQRHIRRSFSIRIDKSDRALMFFRCHIITQHIKIDGSHSLAIKPDYINNTYKRKGTK